MKFNFALCDDNHNHLNEIKNTICQLSEKHDVTITLHSEGDDLLRCMENMKCKDNSLPDFVLIDIEMPEINGIELAKQVKDLYPEVCLVLVTSYIEYAVKGYEAKADRYLLKPIKFEDVESLIGDFLREQNKVKKIIVKDKEQEHLIFIKDILYISAEDKYTILYTEHNRYFDYKSLKDYEEILADYGFYRIHRKHLINMYHHKSLRKGFVTLTSDVELPLSRRKESQYREQLLKTLGRDLL